MHVFFRRDPGDPNKAIRIEADMGVERRPLGRVEQRRHARRRGSPRGRLRAEARHAAERQHPNGRPSTPTAATTAITSSPLAAMTRPPRRRLTIRLRFQAPTKRCHALASEHFFNGLLGPPVLKNLIPLLDRSRGARARARGRAARSGGLPAAPHSRRRVPGAERAHGRRDDRGARAGGRRDRAVRDLPGRGGGERDPRRASRAHVQRDRALDRLRRVRVGKGHLPGTAARLGAAGHGARGSAAPARTPR